MSWLRRNAAALAIAPVVVGASFWLSGGSLIDIWRRDEDPIERTVTSAERFTWDTTTFALEEVAVVDAPTDRSGGPVALPTGTVAWRTAWRASGPAGDAGFGCTMEMVDGAGRRFGADPVELADLDLGIGCTPGTGDDAADYAFVRYFLLPAGAEPTAVLVGGLTGGTVKVLLR